MNSRDLQRDALVMGSITGGIAVCAYVAWSVLPMPAMLNRLLHFAFGPLLICAFMGIWHYLNAPQPRFIHAVASVFGMLAGTSFTLMTVVQASMVDRVLQPMREATDPSTQLYLKHTLRGTDSVQLGMDIVWDIFITLATILVALSLMGRGTALRAYAIFGLLAGLATLVLNLWTFPLPPAQRGMFDLGPVVGAWFGGICVMMALHVWRASPALRAH